MSREWRCECGVVGQHTVGGYAHIRETGHCVTFLPHGEPTGRKDDGGKWRPSLIPRGLIKWIARVAEYGARKYAVDNWQIVDDAEARYRDALGRHVVDFLDGEWLDPESKLPHLAHIAWNAGALLWFHDKAEVKP